MGIFFNTRSKDHSVDSYDHRSRASIVDSQDIVTDHLEFQYQAALVRNFKNDRSDNFFRIVDSMAERFGDYDQVFYFLDWYFKNEASLVKVTLTDLLKMMKLIDEKTRINTDDLNLFRESTKWYCGLREIASDRFSTADKVLKFIFNSDKQLPLSYETMVGSDAEIIIPPMATLIRMNEKLMDGGSIYMYCCPDYARKQRADGTYEYTMDGLEDGIGLTAEKGIPALVTTLNNLKRNNFAPLDIQVGVADFEATQSNAEMVGVSGIEEFESKLCGSIRNMAIELTTSLGSEFEVEIASEDYSNNIGSICLEIKFNSRIIAFATFSRITEKPIAHTDNYRGEEDFDKIVIAKRQELLERAENDRVFQRKLDKLIRVRVSLMIKWANPEDRNVPSLLKKWYLIFKDIEDSKFENMSDVLIRSGIYDLKEYSEALSIQQKEEILRGILLQELFSNTQESREALTYLRKKVAMQGGEYAVMHELMANNPKAVHFVADAMNMWEVFGNDSIDVLGIKGGYTGAEKIES